MYTCVCGKIFIGSQSYNAHQGRCSMNRESKGKQLPKCGFLYRKKPWNKGLTKDSDIRVQRNALAISNTLAGVSRRPLEEEHKRKISEAMRGTCGGYRKGSGKGKKGWYKGYWCDSSWELAYVVYNIDHNIKFRRNTDYFLYEYNGKVHKYFPDFIENGQYIEIKGYLRDADKAKFTVVPGLKVLISQSMRMYLDYATKTYGNNFVELYNTV